MPCGPATCAPRCTRTISSRALIGCARPSRLFPWGASPRFRTCRLLSCGCCQTTPPTLPAASSISPADAQHSERFPPSNSDDFELDIATADKHLEPGLGQRISAALDHTQAFFEKLQIGVQHEHHARFQHLLEPSADLQRLEPDRRIGYANPVAEAHDGRAIESDAPQWL